MWSFRCHKTWICSCILHLPDFVWFWMGSNSIIGVPAVGSWCMTGSHANIVDGTWPPSLTYRMNFQNLPGADDHSFLIHSWGWVLTLPSFLIPESLWAQAPGTDSSFLCHLDDSRVEAELKGRRGKRITGLQNSSLMSFFGECLLIGLSWYILLRNLAEMRKKAYDD